MRLISFLIVCATVVAAAPPAVNSSQRIIGGSLTTIERWPSMANVLFTFNWSTFHQYCGGSIINNRSILTAAHCLAAHPANRFRVRLGSSMASSGGVIHNVIQNIIHNNYDSRTFNNDFAILRTAATIVYNNQVQRANIAGPNYILSDAQVVWATGWGVQTTSGVTSEQLREVQIWTINQNLCAQRYSFRGIYITSSMLCAGWLDIGSRGPCTGDVGGPLYHNGNIVGITSFGESCGDYYFPGINARVSTAANWIQANSQ